MQVFGNNKILMTDEIQETAIDQIKTMIDHPAFAKEKIRIMPDYHKGTGCVIGFTSTYNDLIIPNVIGVDIGCAIITYKLGKIKVNFQDLDNYIRKTILLGCKHRNENQMKLLNRDLINNKLYNDIIFPEEFKSLLFNKLMYLTHNHSFVKNTINRFDIKKPMCQLGTLGSGNHFIELEKDDEDNIYVSIHSGSRNFGYKIACIFQELAKYFMKKFKINVEQDLEYLPIDFGGKQYLEYMKIAQSFANVNRLLMLDLILQYFKINFNKENLIESVHNYVDFDQKIIRKGAIKVMKDTQVVIPLNMLDGIIIAAGKDNKKLKNWNFSAPHGAGRIMGRRDAKRKLKLDNFKKMMKGVWSSSISAKTLDESPEVYKDSNKIIKILKEVLTIDKIIKSIYVLKSED